ncbi:MAG TPA: toll/interleukin-1 receptor domain-containing protein [Sphingomicrobium sp.]|nr:toll/interleukin-1 receptor domain-containing protein [Sphingomicrobium sp.]
MLAPSSVPTETCFLSYARADEQFALRFASDLRSLGALMWMDQLDLRPSEHWDRAIERAIRACSNVIVILSPRSVASENVADEISLAIDCGKPVIPVMIEPCDLPLRITRMHLVDATKDYQTALMECFAEIKSGGAGTRSVATANAPVRGIQDPEVIASATRQLARVIGPIAEILVNKAATQTSSVETFYGLLGLHIHDEAERERFVEAAAQWQFAGLDRSKSAGRATGKDDISGEELERFGKILSAYLGPIGVLIARRESKASTSLKELKQRLAATLQDKSDRAEFSRRAELTGNSQESDPSVRFAVESGR